MTAEAILAQWAKELDKSISQMRIELLGPAPPYSPTLDFPLPPQYYEDGDIESRLDRILSQGHQY